eukprot:TRINITY_DN71144_c0_g1_i1.p2 TRINITY_DN71144_c0_g1~~TRINITY_DN71144_c0_g1_i1.p2  ORF type:complete len:530 (-),score=78.66 TRINITY_DN71144_c0_g1_i1:2633-4222(-)
MQTFGSVNLQENGNALDPFKESFDITKATNLRKFIEMEEIKDVSDPRFQKHLNKKLWTLFSKADVNKSGVLEYDEFVNVVNSLNFGLGNWDMQALLAIVDKNNDGVIQYSEFHELAIDLIMCSLIRSKVMVTEKEIKTVAKEPVALIYGDEINQITQVLSKKFRATDPEGKGMIPKEEFKKILTQEKLTTLKERNLLLNNYTKDQKYEYKNFSSDLLEVRYQIVVSGLLESHLEKVEDEMMELFKKRDIKGTGFLTPQQIKEALLESNFTNLTPLQIYSLIGMSNPKGESRMDYKAFATNSKMAIQNLYGLDAIRAKLEMRAMGKLNMAEMEESQVYDAFEMFGLFKKYDTNRNGYLELSEYTKCLKDAGIKLSDPELVTLALFADTNGNNKIDYEEFNKHFPSLLKIVKMHQILNDAASLVDRQLLSRQITGILFALFQYFLYIEDKGGYSVRLGINNNNKAKEQKMEMEGNPFAALARKQETIWGKLERYTLKVLYYGLIPGIILAGNLHIDSYNYRIAQKAKESLC